MCSFSVAIDQKVSVAKNGCQEFVDTDIFKDESFDLHRLTFSIIQSIFFSFEFYFFNF